MARFVPRPHSGAAVSIQMYNPALQGLPNCHRASSSTELLQDAGMDLHRTLRNNYATRRTLCCSFRMSLKTSVSRLVSFVACAKVPCFAPIARGRKHSSNGLHFMLKSFGSWMLSATDISSSSRVRSVSRARENPLWSVVSSRPCRNPSKRDS
jgi:hypothetical protein